jgi:hypothetical protein
MRNVDVSGTRNLDVPSGIGPAGADVTEVYAEKNPEQARQIAKEMG